LQRHRAGSGAAAHAGDAAHVQAGSLRFSVNGSTVSIFTKVNALPHGFLCIVDLTRSGAPPLVAGANTVTVSYLDTWNASHTDTFRILYAASEDELAGLLFDRTMAAFFREANAAGAIRGLRETLTHKPCLAPAWYNMARMEESLRHWPQASDAFRNYLACSPQGPFSAKARQQLIALAGLPDGQPLPPEALYAATLKQAQHFLVERHYRDALTQAAAAQQLLPQRYEAYAFAAGILRSQHQDTDAARLQAMALERVTPAQRPALEAAFAAQ